MIPLSLTSCKELEKKSTEEINSIEITVSCNEENDLEKYINEGWKIAKEYSE